MKSKTKTIVLSVVLILLLVFFVGRHLYKTNLVQFPSVIGSFFDKFDQYVIGIDSEEEANSNNAQTVTDNQNSVSVSSPNSFTLSVVPEFSGYPYIVINDNVPYFTDAEIETYSVVGLEQYSDLDELGRCGATIACVGKDTMPKENRGDISNIKPSGWKNAKYDFIDGGWVYNRCHLIGWQLTAENDNEHNLITGTRYMNVQGMLPFENMVADHVKETNQHILYRVTPVFKDNELVARGVLMEAYSLEDNGLGVQYCVFCYNVQPQIQINYLTGATDID